MPWTSSTKALRDALERAGAGAVELAMLGKHRQDGSVRTEAFVGEVASRIAVIVDDMIVTGTTLIPAAEACRRRGAVGVHAMATHGVFTQAAGELLTTPAIDSVIVTDTVSTERFNIGSLRAKLTIVSIAPLLARAISTLHHDGSLTQMVNE